MSSIHSSVSLLGTIVTLLHLTTYIQPAHSQGYSQGIFSCQGTNYPLAVANCPDEGSQQYSSGGNVTVHLKSANNLPNRDIFGPASGLSDPYVRFIIGNQIIESRRVPDNLNPVWDEYINLGVLGSATLIGVDIYDRDTGLEFADDLLVTGSFRIPFCTTMTANYSQVDCNQPHSVDSFNCRSDDSLWAMPVRQMCHESGYVSFADGKFCDSAKGICMQLDIYIVPYTMEVELENPAALIQTPELNVAGQQVPQSL